MHDFVFPIDYALVKSSKTTSTLSESGVEKEILALIGVDNKIQLKEISERLEIPKRNFGRIITAMKNNGIIKRIGSARGRYWEISK